MLLFFCCSSGTQPGARLTTWGADRACKTSLQVVHLDSLITLLTRKHGY
nr:MAG TPA: hypothetical protein [Caudoviricetes sp.]